LYKLLAHIGITMIVWDINVLGVL